VESRIIAEHAAACCVRAACICVLEHGAEKCLEKIFLIWLVFWRCRPPLPARAL